MSTEQGFAIRRNGSCLADLETDCGATVAPFRGCCPKGYSCPAQYNIACCLSGGNNCTDSLLAVPSIDQVKCANETWDLFDNRGYFCCEHGLTGYNNADTNGCSKRGQDEVPSGITWLSAIRTGTATPVSIVSSLTSATVSITAAAAPTEDQNKSPNVGAIVGGVVGGVAVLALIAVLAWFFMRRRKQSQVDPYSESQEQMQVDALPVNYGYTAGPEAHEMEDGIMSARSELASGHKPAELPQQAIVELYGEPRYKD